MRSPSLWLVFHFLNGVCGRVWAGGIMTRSVCNHKTALVHLWGTDCGGPPWLGRSITVAWLWADGGLGWGCLEGWREEAACEECTESKTRRACRHTIWILPEGKLGSPDWSTGHHIIIIIVFNSETPINFWDFSILIIWERVPFWVSQSMVPWTRLSGVILAVLNCSEVCGDVPYYRLFISHTWVSVMCALVQENKVMTEIEHRWCMETLAKSEGRDAVSIGSARPGMRKFMFMY